MVWCLKNLIYFCQTGVGRTISLSTCLPLKNVPLCVTKTPWWFVFSWQPFASM